MGQRVARMNSEERRAMIAGWAVADEEAEDNNVAKEVDGQAEEQ